MKTDGSRASGAQNIIKAPEILPVETMTLFTMTLLINMQYGSITYDMQYVLDELHTNFDDTKR